MIEEKLFASFKFIIIIIIIITNTLEAEDSNPKFPSQQDFSLN